MSTDEHLVVLENNQIKGKSTGNHKLSHEIWDFPENFPWNQSIETNIETETTMAYHGKEPPRHGIGYGIGYGIGDRSRVKENPNRRNQTWQLKIPRSVEVYGWKIIEPNGGSSTSFLVGGFNSSETY